MDASNEDRLGMVRVLLETAPDSAVRSLETALSGVSNGDALSSVRTMVRQEVIDRGVRDIVLAPLLPFCSPRPDGFKQALFPQGIMPRLWKAMRKVDPQTMAAVSEIMGLGVKTDVLPVGCDELCRSAARALKAGQAEMAQVAAYLDGFRPGAAADFAGYLDMVPFARKALRRLPSWLRGMSGEHAAAVRLLFKDAGAAAQDASPRVVEFLLAQTKEPWKLLPIISAVTKRAGDNYLSNSEMAEFCERILADIDRRLAMLRAFDPDKGPDAAMAAADVISRTLTLIGEFEAAIDLNREGPWGQRVAGQRGELSSTVEGYIKRALKHVGEALPLQPPRTGQSRALPHLGKMPDMALVGRAAVGLLFLERCRSRAAAGGYEVVRTKTLEELTHDLDGYVEDLLSTIHGGDAASAEPARAFLDVAADFTVLVLDVRSAEIVRRRAAAAA